MVAEISENIARDVQKVFKWIASNIWFLLFLSQNDAEAAREAYTKFLERYPYCYGYWRKFADYEKKKGNPENVQTVSPIVYYVH